MQCYQLPIVLSSVLAAAAFFVGLYCCISSRIRRKRTQTDEKQSRYLLEGGIIDDDGENMCYLINLHDIMVATNAFSDENKLGEGGFGPVYKGKLPNGMDVAIKRLSKTSSQGLTEFKNEVVLIIKLQHKNLVRLLGYCVEGGEKLLIYEYMSNKSLDVLLFDSLKGRELNWEKRMKIVNGTTRGLQYLHEDSRLRIIHRDLKASNILLDDEMNPKISDFGTARIFGCKQIDDSTQRIVGTFGYMSPEYALSGMISEKSDIYSFRVLLLEIISGKKATRFVHNDQKQSLIAFAWESWYETKGVCIIDEALCGSYSLREVMLCVHIALLCVQDHPKDRPTITQIVYMFSNDNNLPIPKQPTFSNVLNGDQQITINEATKT
ncbi:G-type lectin S-receptor-like serine/threonine-protein kinase [Cardamine amara subsp. amara]|uniref:non-specific serine/threonine protein kinase n=1 Tax=Cardamine amara subsp. amara TaxID=228776 RepID=A0ABD1BWR9_CARAN